MPQPFGQRAAHLLGLPTRFGRFARVVHPVVQLDHRGPIVGVPGGQRAQHRRQLGARQRQVQLVAQPARYVALGRHTAGLDRRFQSLGVAETADRQRRRGQPDRLQQRGGAAGAADVTFGAAGHR